MTQRRHSGVSLALRRVYFHVPGDHRAAETVDERQSAGIREEDKAESVRREAGL